MNLQQFYSFLKKMQWTDRYVLRPAVLKVKSLVQNFNNLTINQQESIEIQLPAMMREISPKIESFDEFSFTSSLQRQFKDNGFTFQPNDEERMQQSGIFVDFTLQLCTQYENLNVIVGVQINLRLEYIRYHSYLIRNNQMLSFTRDQINTISKYLSINFNPKNPLGCMSVDTESGQIIYQTVNNSLGHLQRRIKKAPNELLLFIDAEIKEIEKIWRTFLPNFLRVMSIPECKNRNHPFWRTYKEKKNIYDGDEFNLLTEYIKQSYIEHPFMFDEVQEINGNRVLRKIRSRFLTREEKNKKRADYEKMMSNKQYYSYKLTSDLSNILQAFTSSNLIDYEYKRRKFEIPDDKKTELSMHLVVENFESRHLLYSQINVREIRKEMPLTKSGFSHLKLLHVLAKKMEDNDFNLNPIVSKETQPSRFINETDILRTIGNGRSLFITRFFFSENENMSEGRGLNDKILLEYCPLKSIDSYLHAHKKFITLETKLFFLYEIAVGLRFLRDYGVIHNDLKPQNVLLKIMTDKTKVSSTFMLRLIDFGESYNVLQTPLNKSNQYKRGFTIPYASPEQTKSLKFTEKNDIFSFGVMFYEIIFDIFPVEVMRKGKEVYMTEENYLKFYALAPEKCKYYNLPKVMQILYHLCLRCLSPYPSQRPVIDWIVAILRSILLFGDTIYQF